MPNKEEKRITEQSSLYEHLEKMSVDELTAHINAENKKVALAIEQALPAINQLISAIEGQLKKGGRLFYAGCGTGGRLATLDTIEVQNTYGIDGSQIQAIFPGGIGCLTQTRESREDDLENGWHQLCDKHISEQDFVLGFSASGTTPFVLSILQHCKEAGIPTGCIVNNPHAPIAQAADYPVEVITGPEFVTGSTRMKAGSSQKMILDMISTSLQIRQGRVEGNKMVNAKLINHKLIDRACRIFMERNPQYTDYKEVKQLILESGSVKKAEDWLRSIPSKCRTPMASTVHRYKPSSPEASAALRKPGNPEKTTWRMVGTSSAINISQSRISYSVFLPAAPLPSCFPSCSIARKKAFLRVASSTILTLLSPKLPIIP